ncbi:major facilitator superfamily MFS-1 [Babesia ovata]|uniref:Major facilitator superfamily MFS-1 n=1 Tax=Babesia ovata TaxID=189622 RepID=A0A2H6KCU8_9APIC|nr:major facilitator superfamily MFS-1 [Babesia ovata]GBE60815.1 major facilitator superfamily MFS-1 [Babesia ovata]
MKIRWSVRLALYAAVTVFVSAYYDSWSATTTMLVRFGVYKDSCPPPVAAGESQAQPQEQCEEQLKKLSGLLSVFRISEFVTSIGTGVYMDLLGPKICIITAILLRIASWMLLAYMPHYNSLMIVACILCGLTVNAVAFPVYTAARYWPAYQDMAMCIISACLSIGCFYVPIMNLIMSLMPDANLPVFVFVKLLITHLPWLVISVVIFPNDTARDIASNMTPAMAEKNQEMQVKEDAPDDSSWNFKTFLGYIIHPEILVLSVVFILNCISLTFAQESFTQIYINNTIAENFNGIMLPVSFVFSLVFMWVINRYGVVVVMLGLNIVSMAMHAFLLSNETVTSIFASICISVTFSGFITFFFICLEHIVDIKYSGSMKGYLTTVAGLSLAINPLINYLIATYGGMNAWQTAFIIIRFVMIAPFLWLMRRERIRRRSGSSAGGMQTDGTRPASREAMGKSLDGANAHGVADEDLLPVSIRLLPGATVPLTS